MRRYRLSKIACVLLLIVAGVFGCGPGGEKLYRVSGTVTHGGQPVPKGLISFDPQGEGTAGFANILDGKYDTGEEGKGVRGGKYDVRVNGFDGKPGPDAPFGQAIFPEFRGQTELPSQDTTYDLEIPKAR